MELIPLHSEFFGVVTGLRVEGAISRDIVGQLQNGLDRYSVLVFPDTRLDERGLVAFAEGFGDLEDFSFAYGSSRRSAGVSNLDAEGQIRKPDDPARASIVADGFWHTDGSYRPRRTRYSMLVARTIPAQGGGTEFCDTRGAYDALSGDVKEQLEGLVGLHSIIYSRTLAGFTGWTESQRAALPPVPQPLVLANRNTGRRSLYLASHIYEIVGWPAAQTRQFLQDLTEFATQPHFVHLHRWRVNDLVIWDNQATMHRRAPYDDLNERRELTSVRVLDAATASALSSGRVDCQV
jgi:alpha-ketoglutarate-dependent 2,4-dichlorophenoxyacetate dioxygenase